MNKTIGEYQIIDYYKELETKVAKRNCIRPCTSMDVYLGVVNEESDDGSSYLRIYMNSDVKVQETIYDYTLLSMLAEIGGYSGLLLGLSVSNLTIIIDILKRYLN